MLLQVLCSNKLFFMFVIKLYDKFFLFCTVNIVLSVEIQMFLQCLVKTWNNDKNSGPPIKHTLQLSDQNFYVTHQDTSRFQKPMFD